MCKLMNEKSEIRFCNDIGMFAIDRSRLTCKHASEFCKQFCFNNKLYNVYKDMATKDIRNDEYWQRLTGAELNNTLNRKHKQTDRVRFMTRGEAISDMTDIDRIIDICAANPGRTFWLPTRAWRKTDLAWAIKQRLFGIKNLRLMASIDPSNSAYELEWLAAEGWSTMFFGNDETAPMPNSVKCTKTWKHVKGACATCKKGCFSKKQVNVWLKQH